jgi:branched-chain amino acid transport system permease protein
VRGALPLIDLLASTTAVGAQRAIIDAAINFGLITIVAMALNLQYSNAEVPNLASGLSVTMGGFAVSIIVSRLVYWVGAQVGLEILSIGSSTDWANHNNCFNVDVMNAFIQTHAGFGLALFLLSLVLGFAAGWGLGYFISLPAFKLKFTSFIIAMIMIEGAAMNLALIFIPIMGGSQGMFIPNVLAWYPGDKTILMAVLSLLIMAVTYLSLGRMLDSPFGQAMRASKKTGMPLDNQSKDIIRIRRRVLMFGSGLMAITGVLISYYYSYVIGNIFPSSTWAYWPWMALIIGGLGSNSGALVGSLLVIVTRRLLVAIRAPLSGVVWFPLVIFDQQLMALLFLSILMLKPEGLIPAKLRVDAVSKHILSHD